MKMLIMCDLQVASKNYVSIGASWNGQWCCRNEACDSKPDTQRLLQNLTCKKSASINITLQIKEHMEWSKGASEEENPVGYFIRQNEKWWWIPEREGSE